MGKVYNNFDDFHEAYVEHNRYDPLQDSLQNDSWLWKKLLSYLYSEEQELYEIFHGLRCLAFRLEYNRKLKLISNTKHISQETWDLVRKEELLPRKDKITEVFKEVSGQIEAGEVEVEELI